MDRVVDMTIKIVKKTFSIKNNTLILNVEE